MGKPKIRPPYRIETLDPIEIKFVTVNCVGEGTRCAKFYANPTKVASQQTNEIYAKIFIYGLYAFFSSTHPQVRPLKGFFTLNTSNTQKMPI